MNPILIQRVCGLVGYDCHNKISQTGQLKQQNSHSSGSWRPKIQVPGVNFLRDLSPWLAMATLFLPLHMAVPGHTCGSGFSLYILIPFPLLLLISLLLLLIYFIDTWLFYGAVLISAIQQSDSVIHIHVLFHILFHQSPFFF